MKRFINSKLTFILTAIILIALLVFAITVTAKTPNFKTGDKFYYGSYPQTRVTDNGVISSLNALGGEWVSYDYYTEGKPSDFMKYKDVSYGGNKYRGVIFTKYRPNITYAVADAQNSYQDENGYKTDTVYWFKFEPIKWTVLYPSTGLVMSSIILDSQAYRNNFYCPKNNLEEFYTDSTMQYYANNYAESDIRKWLDSTFINTAFTAAEQEKIILSDNFNKAWKDVDARFDAVNTQDKVYLLTNGNCSDDRYGFFGGGAPSAGRQFISTDYAKAQGIGVYKADGDTPRYSFWWARTAGTSSSAVTGVNIKGETYHRSYSVFDTHFGVVPAMRLDLSSIEQ